MPPRSDDHAARQRSLEDFRAQPRRLKTHPAEQAALAVVTAHLVFLPWALGTMRPWAQFISAALAAAGMIIALLPRHYTGEHTLGEPFRLVTWPRLMRFPIFWLGLALFAVITAQGLNPAWAYRTDGQNWWMEAMPHVAWLPVGVAVPFEKWSQWRLLLIYAATWLTVCTVWIAFTRRRTLRRLLVAVALNGTLLALFGLVQQQAGNGKIFWTITSPSLWSFASFVYKNHAGTYLNLTLAVTGGLAGWYYARGLRRQEKSDPGMVFLFFGLCTAVAVFASLARGAMLAMLAFVLVGTVAFAVRQFRVSAGSRRPLVTVALLALFGAWIGSGIYALRNRDALSRLATGVFQQDSSLAARQLATDAALEMLGDHWVRGVGAGSFRFLFTIYQARYPELLAQNGEKRFWEHAHNDLVQFPIELGAAGTALVLLAGGWWAFALLRARGWRHPVSAAAVGGALLTVAGAWWDFPFQCPAILITWCMLWPAAVLWAQFADKK